MKKSTLQLSLVMGTVVLLLTACGSGNNTSQNMPVGGTNFVGTLTPGVGNLQNYNPPTTNTCNASNAQSENVQFQVQSESSTYFFDPSSGFYTNIFSGYFTNPVNQNNPCFTGTILYSQCGNAQSGTIKFNACSVYLNGNHYQFNAVYYLYTNGGQLIQTGTVNATK